MKVLDSWAMLAWLQNETPACNDIQYLLDRSQEGKVELIMNIINVGEVYYNIIRRKDEESANFFWNRLLNMPIKPAGVDRALILIAAQLKGKYPISYADAFAIATAITHDCPLLTGDPEFRSVESLIKIEWLERQ